MGSFDGGKSIVVFKVILTLCFMEEKLKTTNFERLRGSGGLWWWRWEE